MAEAPVLPADEKHGFAEGEYENDQYVRCPLGCDRVWNKAIDSFEAFYWHLEEVHDD